MIKKNPKSRFINLANELALQNDMVDEIVESLNETDDNEDSHDTTHQAGAGPKSTPRKSVLRPKLRSVWRQRATQNR